MVASSVANVMNATYLDRPSTAVVEDDSAIGGLMTGATSSARCAPGSPIL
jgi:hypothetical protein